jgi:GT2 family glycosyltransferase
VVLVENLLASVLERTDYPAFEVVCVVDEKTPPAVADQLRRLDPRVRCLDRKGPFDFADIVNRGVAAAQTDLVLLLNDDTEVVDPDWLTRLVEVAELPGVGAVGVRLLLEDGRFQHVGVSHNPQGLPVHVQWGETRANDYFGSTYADLDYCVVTAACLLTRRSLFAQVGGFSPRFPVNYNDADFCLRLVTSGWRVVQCNAVALHHYESSSRAYLLAWGERSFRDPWAHLFRWAGYAPVGLDAADPVAAGPGVRSSN